jgi:MinD superfamily P-loop ATPase
MKEIVIISGKGGTGKTSVAASLAILAGSEAVIADCDVDAANMHLLLKPDFRISSDFYGGELAVINGGICTSCGLCLEKCRFNAITVINESYIVEPFDCEGCGYCEIICPAEAITMVPRKTGKLFISETRAGNQMVHATMEAGAENSGKMVTKVKQEAIKIADESGSPYIIVDGSPGLGCPVMASLTGADLAVLVTEPSVSGLHDLKRVNEVIKNFRIKTVCIINKQDLNPGRADEIRDFMADRGIIDIASIPYNKDVARGMAGGMTMAETGEDPKILMETIWARIKNEVT